MDELLKPIQTHPLTASRPITLSLSSQRPGNHNEPTTEEPLLTISSSKSTLSKRPVVSTIPETEPAKHVPFMTTDAEVSALGFETNARTDEVVEVKSSEEALKYLRSSSSLEQLGKVLEYLTMPVGGGKDGGQLEIYSPTPMSSQIVRMLVDEIIPQFWPILRKLEKGRLVKCLRSVVGVGGVVAKLGGLVIAASKDEGIGGEVSGGVAGCRELMQVLGLVLGKTTVLWEVWRGVFIGGAGGGGMKGEILWKEWVGLVAGGKVLGVVSAAGGVGRGAVEEDDKGENGDIVGKEKKDGTDWVGHGKVYAQWLGKGVGVMAERLSAMAQEDGDIILVEMGWKCLRNLFWRSFGLGTNYWDEIVETTTIHLLLFVPRHVHWDYISHLLLPSMQHDKSRYLNSLLRILSRDYLEPIPSEIPVDWWQSDAATVSRVARVISGITRLDPGFWTVLVEWVHSAAGVGEGIGIRRAVLTVLSTEGKDGLGVQGGPQEAKRILERAMKYFGDSLWIKHTPVQVQEANIQTILLCAGYLHRGNPTALKEVVRSPVYLHGISNRLAVLSPRARFLGMVVGEVLSGLVDDKEMKLEWKMEEMESTEALWWKGLAGVEDKVGDIHGLERIDGGAWIKGEGRKEAAKRRNIYVEQVTEEMDEEEYVVEVIKGEVIEAEDGKADDEDTSDDEDEFKPYPKPDDDEEDDEEDDPTLVNRNNPPPPVYIRDLLRLLRSHDNYEHQQLALTHAAPLISRKAAFGTELTEHFNELATSLAGLQDNFDIEGFQEMKTSALIALIVGKPVEMGRWIARAIFEGEFSIGARAVLLTALGMGARELGGLRDEVGEEGKGLLGFGASSGQGGEVPFPSKMLPGKLHELWSSPSPAAAVQTHRKAIQKATSKKQITDTTRKIDVIASSLEKAMIQPMATSAADELSGPNILKVRTFSSRMAVEAKRKKPEANKLAKIIGEAFFYPLTGRWWAKLREFGPNAPQFNPYLLSHLLKTLVLILHAAGPGCPQLPQLTREFWDLLLGLRAKGAVEDRDAPAVLEAVLFALLTLLELNMDLGEGGRRRLVEEHARELVETGEWVEGVFESCSGGGSGGVVAGGVRIGIGGMGGEEERVRRLAAAVVLRVRECAEGFERRLRGEMGRWE